MTRGHPALFPPALPAPHALGCDPEQARDLGLGVVLVQEFHRAHAPGFGYLGAGQGRNGFTRGGGFGVEGRATMLSRSSFPCPHN